MTNCLSQGCHGRAKWKGLCGTCYSRAKALVTNGVETWGTLAEQGLVRLDERLTPFDAAYKKAKDQQDDGK